MCTREEVKMELSSLERRINEKIEALEVYVEQKIHDSHNEIARQIHVMSPETRKEIDAKQAEISSIKETVEKHAAREEGYWKKIDGMHDFMRENRELILKQNNKVEDAFKYLPAMQVVADLLTGGRVMGWFGKAILWISGILGALYVIRDTFKKD